jgi:hypothetical protein
VTAPARAASPDIAASIDIKLWPTATEAAVQLGTNERTIRRFIASRRLGAAKRPVVGAKPQTVVDPADVERVRAERAAPVVIAAPHETAAEPSVGDPAPSAADRVAALAARPEVSDALVMAAFKAALYERPVPAPQTPFLTLSQAEAVSGLPKRLLARLVRDGRLPALRYAGVAYVRRADLEALEVGTAKP